MGRVPTKDLCERALGQIQISSLQKGHGRTDPHRSAPWSQLERLTDEVHAHDLIVSKSQRIAQVRPGHRIRGIQLRGGAEGFYRRIELLTLSPEQAVLMVHSAVLGIDLHGSAQRVLGRIQSSKRATGTRQQLPALRIGRRCCSDVDALVETGKRAARRGRGDYHCPHATTTCRPSCFLKTCVLVEMPAIGRWE